jgi:hypothetical protein
MHELWPALSALGLAIYINTYLKRDSIFSPFLYFGIYGLIKCFKS